MIVGAVGVVGSGILVGRATLKLTKVLDESKNTIDSINDAVEDENIEYAQEDAASDLGTVRISTVATVVKLYAPAVIVSGLSIACMIQSHNILKKRNVALAAAFATVTQSFSRYRKAVVDKYGERTDYEFKHGIRTEKVSVTETDENGKTKTKKETIDIVDGYSDYARFYDDGCTGWTKDAEYNLMFLKSQQQYANDKLIANGFLFLNDVYKELGIPPSKEGQIVGWIYDLKNPNGDNFVDFGIYDVNKENARDFVNGYEQTILLDFNVDGNVWDNM